MSTLEERIANLSPGKRKLLSQWIARQTQPAAGKPKKQPENELVAYVVPRDGVLVTARELRSFLKERLPEYMVPSAFLMLDALPLTSSGKLDRRSLPHRGAHYIPNRIAAPRTQTERALATIWCDVLGLERVGIDDNFFELGGHSLLATQVVSQSRDTFHIELPLRAVFETKTLAELALAVEAARHIGSEVEGPPVMAKPRTRDMPLSFAQQRLWALDHIAPGMPTYNICGAVHISGVLDSVALERSLAEIIRRHEVLRTTFVAVHGQPVQRIAEHGDWNLPAFDLSELSQVDCETEVARLENQEARRPFELDRGPLVRTALLRTAADKHILLVSMHHIVSDGWSLGLLVREVTTLYHAFSTGTPSPLRDLPIQYADFALWQRERLRDTVLERQLAYWKEVLPGAPPLLALPTDRPRSPVHSFRGGVHSFILPQSLSSAIHSFSLQEGVTVFMTLLAALQTLLMRYTCQDDILVGSPVAGRNRSDFEELIGCFVNTLVLRTDFSRNPTVRELIQQVHGLTLGAYEHQELPFEKLVEALNPNRDLSHSALFQVMFVFQNMNTAMAPMELPGLTLTPYATSNGTAKFDLTLTMEQTPHGLVGSFEYSADLFDESTIVRLTGHFQELLHGMIDEPEQRVASLRLLTEAERHRSLEASRKTRADYPREASLYELFEDQVEQTPDAVALVFNDQHLSYAALNRRANRLAHRLRRLGVGPEVPVAIYMEPSMELVIGLLGILKSGGAYVPLDMAYPKERLAFLMEDAGVHVVVTQQSLGDRLPVCIARLLFIDADEKAFAAERAENPAVHSNPSSLAYVIYTSGSTGLPKGVLVSHWNAVRLLEATEEWFDFSEKDVWTLFHSCAFDFSVWELWGALLYGGRLIIVPHRISRSPEDFYRLLCNEGVTVLNQTPSAFRQLMWADESLGSSGDLALRLIIFGGEAIQLASLRPWFDRHGDNSPQLVNMYGITETTVHVTYRPIRVDDLSLPAASVIGIPIPDLQVYILDPAQQLVPVGVAGEVYVGGAGVARGYLNQPDLTAERFVPDPFSGLPGARLYRSGDLARYLVNGDLEYLGRVDQQVKIRGFRIEPGEIEGVLLQHPSVREVVVVTYERASGETSLAAYVVSSPILEGGDVEERASVPNGGNNLRSFLRGKLPEYMVPSVFVVVDAIPLSSNGKLDRQALPSVGSAPAEQPKPFAAPRNVAEAALAEIWGPLLRLNWVGIHDNFFELGGDSILAIQVVNRARKAGIELTPKQLFQFPTIAELAAAAGTAPAIQAEQGVVTGPVPLMPIQWWFFDQDLPDPHHWNQAILLEVHQAVDPVLLERVARHLFVYHDALRLRFTRDDTGWRQVCAMPEQAVPFTCVDLSHLPAEKQEPVLQRTASELQASLDLSEGPLFRITFFRLGPDRAGRLLIVIHHLAVDGVSWRILLEDLQTAYEQIATSGAVQAIPKTTSFKQWAERMVEYASSEVMELELAYWSAKPWSHAVRLPVDFPNGMNSEGSVRSIEVFLSIEETQQLLKQVPEAYRTNIEEPLLTALAQTLGTGAGLSPILIDLEGHGREALFNNLDVSRTVGWFTTIFPVLLEWREGWGFGDALKSIKEHLRQVPCRGVGYGLLRYLVSSGSGLGAVPQPQVSFNYLGQLDSLPLSAMFGLALGDIGPTRSPRAPRRHLLEVTASVVGQRLQVTWAYSVEIHSVKRIQAWADHYVQALRSIIAHCLSPDVRSYPPSDFALARLEQQHVSQLALGNTLYAADSRAHVEQTHSSPAKGCGIVTERSGASVFTRFPLKRLHPREYYKLSPYQYPEYFFARLAPDSPMYNILICDVLFTGDLDFEAMARAWEALVNRHAVFRTHFGFVEGKAVQIVGPKQRVRVEDIHLDFTWVPEAEFVEQTTQLAHEYAGATLDFDHGPMFHVKLAEFPGKRFLLLFLTNHVLWDEVSSINMTYELMEAYNAFRSGRPPALPEMEVDYVDYAEWVNDVVDAGVLAREREYWLSRFADNPPPLDLPVDFPRPPQQTFNGADVSGVFPRELTRKLLAEFLKRNPEMTLSMVLHAIFNLQLHRLTGQTDIVLGMPIANRGDERLERVLGPFATGMLMRCTATFDMTFDQLLKHTRAVTIDALDHYAYPSVITIQEINPKWDPSRGRLFSVMYGLQHNKTQLWRDLDFEGVQVSRLAHLANIGPLHTTARTDLRFIVEELDEDIFFSWSYNSDLFRRTSVERIAEQYFLFLDQVLRDPHRRLSDYRLMTEEEEHRILVDFNVNEEIVVPEGNVQQCFETQVARNPMRTALVSGDHQWSYGQLNEAANQWAHYLISRGIEMEEKVGLLFDSSPELVVAVLGVLKAGAAYVPLSPDLPAARKESILACAGVRIVLAHTTVVEEGLPLSSRLIHVGHYPSEVASFPKSNPQRGVEARNLAVVFFTSGTTGIPKGIEIEHRGILNVIQSTQNVYGLGPDDTSLFVAPHHFDASILDFLWPLAVGAVVAIPRASEVKNPACIGHLIRRHGVKLLQCVPTMLEALIEGRLDTEVPDMASLRTVICGSAVLTRELRNRFRSTFDCQLINHYGPTEVTVDASRFDTSDAFDGDIVPIGRPIANTRMYLLDVNLQPVPVGVTGEIYIASCGLARGYLDDAAKTAAQFLPDPFSPVAGSRMYRTGDLGRYSIDGTLYFHGRVDRQVKVRGNRVELDEIETQLSAHPAVGRCVVQRHVSGEHDFLVAYVAMRERANVLSTGQERFRVFTLAQRPEIKRASDALHAAVWPEYFVGDKVMQTYWPRLAIEFPHFQLALLNGSDEVVAVGNAIPIFWDGTVEGVPQGWDAGLKQGFTDAAASIAPNTLLVLAAAVGEQAARRGLSELVLQAFRKLARARGLEQVLVPVRPTGKSAHPETSFEDWCQRRRGDGLPMDNWLRVHERLGGRFLKIDLRSQYVRAELADWEKWASRKFTESGEYHLKDSLQPVAIHLEEGYGEYYDPSVWMGHTCSDEAVGQFDYIDGKALREFLRGFLPDYMVPEHFRFVAEMPLTATGKVDALTLPEFHLGSDARPPSLPPKTPLQQGLAEIWKRILEIETVGVTDDFFALGGHSILAVQMLAKVENAFGVMVALREFFEEPTIRRLEGIVSSSGRVLQP